MLAAAAACLAVGALAVMATTSACVTGSMAIEDAFASSAPRRTRRESRLGRVEDACGRDDRGGPVERLAEDVQALEGVIASKTGVMTMSTLAS